VAPFLSPAQSDEDKHLKDKLEAHVVQIETGSPAEQLEAYTEIRTAICASTSTM
jgi:hypothetical protein